MDLDLEIISEEGDCPDPLFSSIMNAMNSMKEATADKIYQKIQKEGETNYSKPQVDRALASALKYGIFEVRNNRYRVRDDILDDEDTVYWKLKKTKEETPFQVEDCINPEKDNQRFRKISNTERQECPQCGRAKRPITNKTENKEKPRKKEKKPKPVKRQRKTIKQNKKEECRENVSSRKVDPRRRTRVDSHSEERQVKVRKISGMKRSTGAAGEHIHIKENHLAKNLKEKKFGEGGTNEIKKFESTDESDFESVSSPSDDGQSFTSMRGKKQEGSRRKKEYQPPQKYQDAIEERAPQRKLSTNSLQTDSESDKSVGSSCSSSKNQTAFMENLPCTSRSASNKEPTGRNQFVGTSELYGKQFGREQVDQSDRKPDWMGYAEQPQGNIIESNNVLTIEPMDSMGFKSQEQASYIS